MSAKSSVPRAAAEALRERPQARVLVIGGGINGVGTFRDLALQGVDVALVERGDYCQGASGASSHMIHGGIRYLENGEFRLVRESVVERNRLLRIAPHYVKPLQTTIPIFSTFSGVLSAPLRFLTHKQQGKPKERGAFLIKLGLSMYDSFSRDGGSVPRHQFRGRKRALAELPRLHPGIKYAATYFDASVHNPERLTLDVLQDGEKAGMLNAGPAGGTARASNYVSLQSMGRGVPDGNGSPAGNATTGSTVQLRDELTGEVFDFTADVIVNTTGAWVDLTNEAMGAASRFMGGTKGSHIVLDHPDLLEACKGREIFFEHTDGRIVLIYPMGDRVLVGTTDVDADMAQDAVCTDGEIDYFLELIGHVFPDIPVDRGQIVYTFSGVRPLPRHDATQPGFVSRDYRIERQAGGPGAVVFSLVGGKWTTFRALAEHLANDVLAELGMERQVSTAKLAIGGGAGFPADEQNVQAWIKAHVSATRGADRTALLLTRYGTRAEEVIRFLDAGPDRLLRSTRELSVRELEFMARNEQIGHLTDVLIRRTSLAFRGLVTGELLNEVSEVIAGPLGWDAAARAREIHNAEEVLGRLHRVQVHSLVA
ncbi:glycerol-3-phosphate dehydrogenase/oxidase [Pseudarthrobacter sp. TAF60_1]|uniref:glycerol-3-phosphate dehydrogenase/oxidase n=1 Tax=Pseudarthrobacter sp. TAF60_1 TaxID=3233071 RepID=UPI003F96B402